MQGQVGDTIRAAAESLATQLMGPSGAGPDTSTPEVIRGPVVALSEFLGLREQVVVNVVESAAVILLLLLLRWVALRVTNRQTQDPRTRYQARKIIGYVATLIGVLLVGRIWFRGVAALATFLGLLAAGVAIALRDPLVNFAGWIFILWRRPFSVGDRIQVGENAGDVVDQRLFQFTILEIGNWVAADQSTGRIIHIPNGKVFTEPVANYVRGFRYIWHEIPVLVTFESDWKKAKRLLTEVVERNAEQLSEDAEKRLHAASRRFMIFYTNLTPIVYTTVADSGVLLTLRFLCDPRRRRSTQQTMWEDILERFAEHDDIDLAYPTTRFYDHVREGKVGLRPGSGRTGPRLEPPGFPPGE